MIAILIGILLPTTAAGLVGYLAGRGSTGTAATCCEHNPCPAKPTWFPHRFQNRPWRCPQCRGWWIINQRTSWGKPDGFEWVRVSEAVGDAMFIEDLQ